MDRLTDGWMDGWMDGRTDGWGWMDGWIRLFKYLCMHVPLCYRYRHACIPSSIYLFTCLSSHLSVDMSRVGEQEMIADPEDEAEKEALEV